MSQAGQIKMPPNLLGGNVRKHFGFYKMENHRKKGRQQPADFIKCVTLAYNTEMPQSTYIKMYFRIGMPPSWKF